MYPAQAMPAMLVARWEGIDSPAVAIDAACKLTRVGSNPLRVLCLLVAMCAWSVSKVLVSGCCYEMRLYRKMWGTWFASQ